MISTDIYLENIDQSKDLTFNYMIKCYEHKCVVDKAL